MSGEIEFGKCEICGKEASLRRALEEISNPLFYMKKECEEQGAILNGIMALQLVNDANYLKKIARQALAATPTTRYERIEEAAKKIYKQYILGNQHHVQEDCECNTCVAIKNLADALKEGE